MLLAAGLTAGALFATGIQAADPVTVVSWGGSYGAAQDAALFNDASKNTGIAINRESGASMSKACLQVESGAVSWDLVVTGSGGSASAAAKGCLEKLTTVLSMFRISFRNVHRLFVSGPMFSLP